MVCDPVEGLGVVSNCAQAVVFKQCSAGADDAKCANIASPQHQPADTKLVWFCPTCFTVDPLHGQTCPSAYLDGNRDYLSYFYLHSLNFSLSAYLAAS